ncbi:hypothetical protein GKC30_12810 [Pseudodesulfovibrio sp. F-1]|uniref:Uncharacterized protein n=1 Tax=Pseudodesulfovibrio alkaliphilus TaxID=2661613 RepID=A0A7K1KR14_9BACT|nr:MptD family putative ECF transporter S component [Pseudodesulfovibrio alkaliphilus]MUM78517.1 hypothetical protein [Pseudodesulfovibrio alkaliphilus]
MLQAESTTLTELSGEAPPAAWAERKRRHWPVRDLIVIGIFAAVVKISSLIIALVGGGMNPLTLIVKNAVFTSLLVVLLHKVPRLGTLTLFVGVSAVVSLLLLGSGAILLPMSLVAALFAEMVITLFGGYRRTVGILVGVAVYDLASKGASLGISWLVMREQPELLITISTMVAIGYLGALAGLYSGHLFVKELRHAGIVHQ